MTSDPAPQTPPSGVDEYEAQRIRDEAGKSFGPEPVITPPRPVNGYRVMPHSKEAERHVAASVFLEPDAVIPRCIEARVGPASFYTTEVNDVMTVAFDMHSRKQPVSVDTVAEELTRRGVMEKIGGYKMLVDLSGAAPTTAQTSHFIKRHRDLAIRREFIRTASSALDDAFNDGIECDDLLAQQEAELGSLFKRRGAGVQTYTVWSPAAFRAWTPEKELNLLGDGYLRRRQITTCIGPPGTGKSRLSLWLACCHIAGRSWCGLEPHGGDLRWLMIGNENDPERQKRDLDWFYRNLTKDEQTKVDQQLFLHVLDSHEDANMTLVDPSVYARMVATLRAVKPDVMVCDPWGNMIEANENDNEEVRRTLKLLLRAISEGAPDAAIIIIHHARTGKANTIEAGNNYSSGSLGRGSKVLVSQARCELALWPGDSEDSSKLVLTCEKVNNAPKFEPIGLTFENGIYSVDSAFSVKGWRDDIEGKRSEKAVTVADVVRAVRGGVTRAGDIADRLEGELGASRRTIQRRLIDAVKGGYLVSGQPNGIYSVPGISKDQIRNMTEPKTSLDFDAPVSNPNDPEDVA